ncbi:hypothetical protein FEE59_18930 [Herbaspirillum sp. RU 5E]|nr:hypothetical protein [Herbaspirillum sp. RU 5E]
MASVVEPLRFQLSEADSAEECGFYIICISEVWGGTSLGAKYELSSDLKFAECEIVNLQIGSGKADMALSSSLSTVSPGWYKARIGLAVTKERFFEPQIIELAPLPLLFPLPI